MKLDEISKLETGEVISSQLVMKTLAVEMIRLSNRIEELERDHDKLTECVGSIIQAVKEMQSWMEGFGKPETLEQHH